MSLAPAIVDWLVRRCRQGHALDTDLVLIQDSPDLGELPETVLVLGQPWRIARATGELTLRAAMLDGTPMVGVVPDMQLPEDLAGRTFLGRILPVKAEDLVAAVAQRFCEPLLPEVAGAVRRNLDRLSALGDWSFGGTTLSNQNVMTALASATLGDIRLDRTSPADILVRWLVDGVPDGDAQLMNDILTAAHGTAGKWLAWCLHQGSTADLVAAGAADTAALASTIAPGLPIGKDHKRLRRLVERAVRDAGPAAEAVLSEVEQRLAGHADLSSPETAPLLRGALDRALHRAAAAAAEGLVVDQEQLDALRVSVHAPSRETDIACVHDLCRLARFGHVALPESIWDLLASQHTSWADLALRRVRRALPHLSPALRASAERTLVSAVERRDAWNLAFAQALSASWPQVASSRVLGRPLPLQQVTRALVRRLVDADRRVLLLVLDGCDLSAFLELSQELATLGIGRVVPPVSGALADDLRALATHGVAVAPLPTVTSHARRALFAGDIPGDPALDDSESAAANASADRTAFKRNASLGDTPRRLFLKGDLGADGQPVVDALQDPSLSVVGLVLNGVDDALSSRETGPAPEWTIGALGAGAARILRAALGAGWDILVTADHGHTPYLSPDRKLSPSSGARWSREARQGLVRFDAGPLPVSPLFLAFGLGTWHGSQRRGWHGGASLEEVQVPLVLLGRGGDGPAPPAWWSGGQAPRPKAQTPVEDPVPASIRAALGAGRALELVRRVQADGQVSTHDLGAALGCATDVVAGEVYRVLYVLAQTGMSAPMELRGGDTVVWTWQADWSAAVPEGPARAFFKHLAQHGRIDQREADQLFGSARKFRKFRTQLDDFDVPFDVRVENSPQGDVFVKEDA